MFKRIAMIAGSSLVLFGILMSGNKPIDRAEQRGVVVTDLYHVTISGQSDAEVLLHSGVDPILRVRAGYLVLAEPEIAELLAKSGLEYYLVESGIYRSQMALDIRHDRLNVDRYPILYEEGELRLFRVDPSQVSDTDRGRGFSALPRKVAILYDEPAVKAEKFMTPDLRVELDWLIDLISQDSLESYSYYLEAYRGRPAGANYGPAMSLKDKFANYGYDSLYIDDFWRMDHWGTTMYHGWNVIATKLGTLYPEDHIIIGAHFDTEAISPGADDNGSGTAAVLEMARVLQDIETNMTIVFVLFDCEEEGLLGAFEYAEQAFDSNERIVFMLNLDMIAELKNDSAANLYTGPSTTYAEIWTALADSLSSVGITGYESGSSGSSDHAPFVYLGYDVVFVHERILSGGYHTARDSTTYMNFDYMTRMTKASLATAYYVDGSHIPDPALLMSCPDGMPEMLEAGESPILRIKVEEYAGGIINPGGVRMFFSINSGPFNSVVMTDVGGGFYEAPFPEMVCGDDVRYYATAIEGTFGRINFLPKPGEMVWAIKTSIVDVVLDDNFESDLGWTVSGDGVNGIWERYRASSNNALPKSDYDRSGRCYLTNHSIFMDVDRGTTILESPSFDVSNGKTSVEYARSYDNGTGLTGKSDIFRVSVFDGNDWIVVDSAGPTEEASGEWIVNKFWLHDVCTISGPIKLRFEASDTGFDSPVEAAVDAVKITYFSTAPDIFTETLPDKYYETPIEAQLEAAGCYDPLAWSDKNNDLEGTGLILTSDGLLSGMPIDTGVIAFTALVTDDAGVSNERDFQFHVWLPFHCGDAGMDYQLNVGDVVYLINYIFKGGVEPYPLCVANANGDDEIDVGDAVYLINHIFKGGPQPTTNCCQLSVIEEGAGSNR